VKSVSCLQRLQNIIIIFCVSGDAPVGLAVGLVVVFVVVIVIVVVVVVVVLRRRRSRSSRFHISLLLYRCFLSNCNFSSLSKL